MACLTHTVLLLPLLLLLLLLYIRCLLNRMHRPREMLLHLPLTYHIHRVPWENGRGMAASAEAVAVIGQ